VLTKTKTSPDLTKQLVGLSDKIGILLMSAATTVGMLEMPDHGRSRLPVIMSSRPVFAFANQNVNENNPLRRERDETAPHYISYSVSQRTPARSGKR